MAHPDLPVRRCRTSISLYVHVPFCRVRCSYCDFYSTTHPELASGVVGATLEQLREAMTQLGEPRARTVFVGGGTPSLLPPELLERLLGALGEYCRPGAELTVEVNPETLDAGLLDLFRQTGVTRVSLGVQSLHEKQLELLGRKVSVAVTQAAIALLRQGWSRAWSADLLSGVPGQSERALVSDLDRILEAGARHVSLYSLTREPGTVYDREVRAGRIREPSPERQDALWEAGRGRLLAAGLRQYEVSNFCFPGAECRHNLAYWRLDPYLGVGPSAVSTLPAADGGAVRIKWPETLETRFAVQPEVELVPPRDLLFEHLMMGLRLEEGVDLDRLRRRFGAGPTALLKRLWRHWRGRGTRLTGKALKLSGRSRMMINALLLDLMDELPPVDKVVWPEWPPWRPRRASY